MNVNTIERFCEDPDTKPRPVTGPSGITYTFRLKDPDDPKSPRIARVDNAQDLQRFMKIEEGYRIYNPDATADMQRPVAPVAAAKPAESPVLPVLPVQGVWSLAGAVVEDKSMLLESWLSSPVPKIRNALTGKHGITKDNLSRLLVAERAGKERKTVVDALEVAISR